MKNRKVLYAALAAALLIAAPAVAEARPYGHGEPHREMGGCGMAGPGYGRMMPFIPQEKQQALSTLMREHAEKVHALREHLWVKRTTLDALSRNPKTEPKELAGIIAEMTALRDQLYKERQAHWTKLEKDFGISMPYGGHQYERGQGGHWGSGHRGGPMRGGL
jgi:zinc resistance-associated protein